MKFLLNVNILCQTVVLIKVHLLKFLALKLIIYKTGQAFYFLKRYTIAIQVK